MGRESICMHTSITWCEWLCCYCWRQQQQKSQLCKFHFISVVLFVPWTRAEWYLHWVRSCACNLYVHILCDVRKYSKNYNHLNMQTCTLCYEQMKYLLVSNYSYHLFILCVLQSEARVHLNVHAIRLSSFDTVHFILECPIVYPVCGAIALRKWFEIKAFCSIYNMVRWFLIDETFAVLEIEPANFIEFWPINGFWPKKWITRASAHNKARAFLFGNDTMFKRVPRLQWIIALQTWYFSYTCIVCFQCQPMQSRPEFNIILMVLQIKNHVLHNQTKPKLNSKEKKEKQKNCNKSFYMKF